MTDTNLIAATQIAKSGTASAPLAGAKTSAAANIAGAGNFWDMLFGAVSFGENASTSATPSLIAEQTNTALPAQVPAPVTTATSAKANPLALLQVALASQTTDENGNIVLTQTAAPIAPADLEQSLALTDQIINHLKNVLPAGAQEDGIFSNLLAKLQTRSNDLRASIDLLQSGALPKDMAVDDIPLPLMIALGLTPAEITQVSEHISALAEKLGRDVTIEDLVAGVVDTAPESAEAAILTAQPLKAPAQQPEITAVKAPALPAIGEDTLPTDDLAAKLNALDVGGETLGDNSEDGITNSPLAGRRDIRADGESSPALQAEMKKDNANFRENLLLSNARTNTAPVTGSAGEILIPSFTGDTESWQQAGFVPSPSLTLGTAAQAAHMSLGAQHAGQSHPATQLVAASMTKAGKDGTGEAIQIQLDPPELGSVNIRLEFGKDKTVKAHLLVEKSETYLMLQRDGLALERALQNAGLDANSESISFELADGGANYTPDNNGEGGGEKNFGRGADKTAGAGQEDVIASTMTWQVDSATGHIRYNILA